MGMKADVHLGDDASTGRSWACFCRGGPKARAGARAARAKSCHKKAPESRTCRAKTQKTVLKIARGARRGRRAPLKLRRPRQPQRRRRPQRWRGLRGYPFGAAALRRRRRTIADEGTDVPPVGHAGRIVPPPERGRAADGCRQRSARARRRARLLAGRWRQRIAGAAGAAVG